MSSNFTLSPSPPATAARVSAYQVASDSEARECYRQRHHCPYRRQLAPAYPDLRNQLGGDRQRGLTTLSYERFRDATQWLHLSKLHVLRTRALPRIGLRPEIVRKVSECLRRSPTNRRKGTFGPLLPPYTDQILLFRPAGIMEDQSSIPSRAMGSVSRCIARAAAPYNER